MHEMAKVIFWLTLVLYVVTLVTVSYVGVYLTYAAIPTIIISGLMMWLTKPKDAFKPKTTNVVTEGLKATTSILNDFNGFMDDVNTSLAQLNKKTELFNERAMPYKIKIGQLEDDKKPLDTHLRYAKTVEEKKELEKQIKPINQAIKELESKIDDIEKQCELEVAKSKD